MLKILKQFAKGKWKEDVSPKKVGKKKPKKRKLNTKSREELIDEFIKSIKKEVNGNGSKGITVARLFSRIGVKKRSTKTVDLLNSQLSSRGYFVSPEITMEISWKDSVIISQYPERKLGSLFLKERALEDYIDKHNLYTKLGIDTVERQYSPSGTRDRLDFLGKTDEQRIVLELKHKDGGKSAVEQVFRYAGYLKREHKDIRKILVTGIQNRETALAIKGHSLDERKGFEWYLYNYNQESGELNFERISDEQIDEQLNVHVN